MQVNSVSNQNFCARVKINNVSKAYFRDASILSTLGTTASGSGVMSNLPMLEPAHHTHIAAKMVDSAFSFIGSIITIAGIGCEAIAAKLFKQGIKHSKIPS